MHEATNRARFGAFVISNEEENLTSINLLPLLRSPQTGKAFLIAIRQLISVVMISGALEEFTCIDVSGHVAGPYASSLLGDLGCEVIKIELPGGGDTHRGRNPKYEGYGPSFRALNRNKKSVTLNLREKKRVKFYCNC